jgi:hypothetical protein
LLVAIKDDAPEPDSVTVLDLSPGSLEVLTADFRLLRDPEAVLRAARDAVRRPPAPVKRLHTFRMMVPRPIIAGTRWESYYETGGYLTLSVPVDDRLEHRARDAIHSQSYLRREEGARALRYFRSDQNIVELKRLLNDPGWAYLRHPQENQGVEVRLYGVRQEAYRALKLWGLDVEEPLIRERIRKQAAIREGVDGSP